jgi:hypothetical protein
MSDFIRTHSLMPEMFHAGRQTDMAKLTVALQQTRQEAAYFILSGDYTPRLTRGPVNSRYKIYHSIAVFPLEDF